MPRLLQKTACALSPFSPRQSVTEGWIPAGSFSPLARNSLASGSSGRSARVVRPFLSLFQASSTQIGGSYCANDTDDGIIFVIIEKAQGDDGVAEGNGREDEEIFVFAADFPVFRKTLAQERVPLRG